MKSEQRGKRIEEDAHLDLEKEKTHCERKEETARAAAATGNTPKLQIKHMYRDLVYPRPGPRLRKTHTRAHTHKQTSAPASLRGVSIGGSSDVA